MAISIRTASYVPTIFLRNAELQAVSELPDSTKDILTPIFCLKPWATAKMLQNSMTKIKDVFGERQYFLDIDPFYSVEDPTRPAQEEFMALVDSSDNNQTWIDFFNQHPNASPCLQVNHSNMLAISNQIEHFTAREKTFLVRLEREKNASFSEIITEVCSTDHANYGFVIDAGWSRDLLSRAVWVDGIVKQIVSLRGDSIPIVVTGSSFPDSFTKFSMGQAVEVKERSLFARLQGDNNQARLIYGDWASSRSPSEGGGGAPIPPRIDLATSKTWEIFRSQEEESFPDIAQLVLQSPNYPSGLHIWATYMIEATALSDPNGIRSLQRAAAVRINMHLYRQLNFANFNPAPDTDDDYIE
ncbi:MAG: hypothetical protein JWS10_2332 [Cypionkella sp.]|uniref:beta family protein n=1 Tax=Cypionkella sp. TaxID=2811411 RepID=UPI0026381D2B|nr:hypothetical protein [Cypionkella sp.]MDB5659717.1 hypothetical protein [Cypionkella sp.]